jgi:hypothetical protein
MSMDLEVDLNARVCNSDPFCYRSQNEAIIVTAATSYLHKVFADLQSNGTESLSNMVVC